MNNLSWFIYLSGLMNVVFNWFMVLAVFGLFATAGTTIWRIVVACNPRDADVQATKSSARFHSGWAVACLILGVVFTSLLPSERTLQLVAASEFGERLIKSERVQGIVDPGLQYVERWLKSQLESKPEKGR